jgi:quinol monooxygenase YgiN
MTFAQEIALVARWFVKPGHEDAVRPALARLAAAVQANAAAGGPARNRVF